MKKFLNLINLYYKKSEVKCMSIILASILSSVIIFPILILILIVFFTILLILYLTFCIGVRNFLIKNGLSTTGFWIPIYNLYLMGHILEFELNCENPLFHYAKYLFPIITIALCFVSDTLGTIITHLSHLQCRPSKLI